MTKMSLTELSEATANFSTGNVIGMGKIGMMYKGVHSNGWSLAIKRVHDSQSFETQFVSELLALGRLKHNNIVPLLGYCKEQKENFWCTNTYRMVTFVIGYMQREAGTRCWNGLRGLKLPLG